MSVTLRPFIQGEIAGVEGKWTHYAVIDAFRGDVTQATANTEQVFPLYTPVAKDWIKDVGILVTESFQNTADAAYNTTTVRVGDTNTDNSFVTATQMNKNGTVVDAAFNTGSGLPKTYLLTSTFYGIIVTLGAQSGKSLNALNKGRVVILLNLFRPGAPLLARGTGSEVLGT